MSSKKLHILFDANSLVHTKSGVGHFSLRLLESLAVHNQDILITAYYFNFLGMKKNIEMPTHTNIQYKVVRFLPTKLLSILHKLRLQLPLEFFINTRPYDFAIFPNFVAIPSFRKIPYCVAVHDLSFYDCPEYLAPGNHTYLKRFVTKSVQKSQFVITISNFTKSRIGHWFGKEALNKSMVLPIPYEPTAIKGQIRSAIKQLATKPYLLFVGTLEPRKNLNNLVRGFNELPLKIKKSHRLILAGAPGWQGDDISSYIEEQADIDVQITGYVTDKERDFLYKNTEALCMISHYEGFGMPVLEAFHYKKPVLLSNIEVFKEIAGNQAVYCDNTSPDDIASGIQKVLSSARPVHVQTISWRQISENVLSKITESNK